MKIVICKKLCRLNHGSFRPQNLELYNSCIGARNTLCMSGLEQANFDWSGHKSRHVFLRQSMCVLEALVDL